MSNGHRWSKFFWADWQSDHALRLCSLAARGLWMELLCIMHGADGYLLVNNSPPTHEQLTQISGKTRQREVAALIAELEAAKVFSRTPDGVIYCRRMVNDIKASEAGREHISKRWANRDPNSPPNSPPNSDPFTKKQKQNQKQREPPKSPTSDDAGDLRSRHNSNGHGEVKRGAGGVPVNAKGNIAWGVVALETRRQQDAEAAARQDAEADEQRQQLAAFQASKGLRYGNGS